VLVVSKPVIRAFCWNKFGYSADLQNLVCRNLETAATFGIDDKGKN
jgi:hypothetical protein